MSTLVSWLNSALVTGWGGSAGVLMWIYAISS
jgi:hypothetical protein